MQAAWRELCSGALHPLPPARRAAALRRCPGLLTRTADSLAASASALCTALHCTPLQLARYVAAQPSLLQWGPEELLFKCGELGGVISGVRGSVRGQGLSVARAVRGAPSLLACGAQALTAKRAALAQTLGVEDGGPQVRFTEFYYRHGLKYERCKGQLPRQQERTVWKRYQLGKLGSHLP